MPFTFARCHDAELDDPAFRTAVVASLLTLGMVRPGQDESEGALGQAIGDAAWLTWNGIGEDLLFIRRARMWRGSQGCQAWLWIGVEFEGVPYRIACAPTDAATRPLVVREVASLGLADRAFWPPREGGFHACGIRISRWAAEPAPGGGSCYAGRTMARSLPLAAPATRLDRVAIA